MILQFTKVFNYKIKLWKNAIKCWVNWGIYNENSHSELNVKTLHDEMKIFHEYEPRTCVKNNWKTKAFEKLIQGRALLVALDCLFT